MNYGIYLERNQHTLIAMLTSMHSPKNSSPFLSVFTHQNVVSNPDDCMSLVEHKRWHF